MKTNFKKFFLLGLVAAALFVFQGCVVEDTPGCGVVGGSGTYATPYDLGNAPACDNWSTSGSDVYYWVYLPSSTPYYVDLFNFTSDLDLYVYTNATYTSLYDSSVNVGNTVAESAFTNSSVFYNYILIDNYYGVATSYTLDIY